MRRVLTVLLLAMAMTAPATAHAADELIAQNADEVAAYGDTQIWSRAVSERENRLMVRRNGVVSELPVPPAREPFDADLGPGPNGGVRAVYARCSRFDRCDVHAYDLDRGEGGEDRIAKLARAGCNETAASSWKRRIVVVRQGRRCGGKAGLYVLDEATGRLRLLRRTENTDFTDVRGGRVVWAGDFFIRSSAITRAGKDTDLYIDFPAEGEGTIVRSPSFGSDGKVYYGWAYYLEGESEEGEIHRRGAKGRSRCETANRSYKEDQPQIQSVAAAGSDLFYVADRMLYRATDPVVEWTAC